MHWTVQYDGKTYHMNEGATRVRIVSGEDVLYWGPVPIPVTAPVPMLVLMLFSHARKVTT